MKARYRATHMAAFQNTRADGCMTSEPSSEVYTVLNDEIFKSESEFRFCERWEQIVESLVKSKCELGWHNIKTSSWLCLSDEIIAIYDALETDGGYPPLQYNERKQYYRAFFKKAAGSAVINALQMEELIHEQVDLGDLDVQEMIKNLPVNNGLFDFKSFISSVCEILRHNAMMAQQNKVSRWKYWYHRLIPIHPNFIIKQAWDVMILLLLVYSCFQVPYSMAFDDSSEADDPQSPKYVADVLLDVVFMVDVALCFLTAYYDAKGMLVRDLRKISSRYTRTWFVPDLGGSFPFDTVISLFLASTGNIGVMRVLKMVRLLKLIRAAKVFHYLGELSHKEGFAWLKSTIGVTRSLFLIIFSAHALGCFFYLFFVPDSDVNWMYTYRPDLRTADDWTRYVTAMYWATISITTMGYGDVVPVTHDERIFCIAVALVGAVVFSYCMGTITTLVDSVTGANYRVAEKLQNATEYLFFRESTTKLKRLIKSFYNLSWRKSGELYKETQIMGDLSSSLRKALLVEIGQKANVQLPLFQGLEDECIGYMFTLLRRADFINGDAIYQKGDSAEDMYFVTSGSVSMHIDGVRRSFTKESVARSGRARLIEAGGSFGELSLFPDLLPPVRHETAVANSWVVAYMLSSRDMPALQAAYPHVVAMLREFCQLKIADGRARGHLSASRRSSIRIGGAVKQGKLKTMIAQMQRDLLKIKEQKELIPASGAYGQHEKKVLNLLIRSDAHEDHDESADSSLTSASCILSPIGELLCIEHTTVGITQSGLSSLAFVVPGLSTYRVLESDEVIRRSGAANRGGAQLFGCCVLGHAHPWSQSDRVDKVSRSEAREVYLYSWLEEEIEVLSECLDHYTRGSKQGGLIEELQSDSQSDCNPSPSHEGALHGQQVRDAQHAPEHFRSDLDTERHSEVSAGELQESRKQPEELWLQNTSAIMQNRSNRSQDLCTTHMGGEGTSPFFSNGEMPRVKGEAALVSGSKYLLDAPNPSAVENCHSKSYGFLSENDILEHTEWLLNLAVELDDNPLHQLSVLSNAFIGHMTLVKKLVDSLCHHHAQQKDGSLVNSGHDDAEHETESLQTKDGHNRPGQHGSIFNIAHDATVFGANFGSNGPPSDQDGGIYSIRPFNVKESLSVIMNKHGSMDSIESLGESCTPVEARWKQLVEDLMKTRGFSSWQKLQQSLFGLPLEIVSVYKTLEVEEGRVFGSAEQKMYYNAFFKKASGFAVINALQMEELIHDQIEIGDANLQEMMNNLPVNNGFFDFKSFIWLLNSIMHNNEMIALQNKLACWRYWYDHLIPIHPDAIPKQIWDVVILLLLLYSCFQVPYSMAFDDSSTFADVLLDVIFMTDVALCFLTAYFDAKGMLVKDLRKICYRYSKSWFLPDIGGSFPFDTVVSLCLNQTGNIGAMRILKLVRLLKLLRALRVFRALNELGNRDGLGGLKNAIGIFRSMFALTFAAHVLGCFFVMLIPDNPSNNWLIDYQPALMQADDWTRYITCLYWAIISVTTMGYGDIKPENGEERIYGIFVALAGAITFSYSMGTISSLIGNVNGSRFRLMEKETDVTEYLHFRELSDELKVKIRTHYRLSWRKSGDLFQEWQILSELSSNLRKEVLKEIGAKCKVHVPILQGFEDECIGYIFTRLNRVDFMEGDLIYQKGDQATEMYFVSRGEVSIYLRKMRQSSKNLSEKNQPRNSRAAKTIEEGETFGELAIFPDLQSPVRYETAVASSWVITYTLTASEVVKLKEIYPHVVARLREFCVLKIADGRARGHFFPSADKSQSHISEMVKQCKLRTMIAQIQRDLLKVKEQSELTPVAGAFGQHEKKILKLMTLPAFHSDKFEESKQLTSMSCVLSSQGELLCIEHNTAGITREGLRSLGFVEPGRSRTRLLEKDEVRQLVGSASKGGAELFGCCVSVQCAKTFESNNACGQDAPGGSAFQDLFLYSWLEEELEALVQMLDVYCEDESRSCAGSSTSRPA